MNDWSRSLYAGVAVANVASAVAVVAVPGFEAIYFTVATVVQGLRCFATGPVWSDTGSVNCRDSRIHKSTKKRSTGQLAQPTVGLHHLFRGFQP